MKEWTRVLSAGRVGNLHVQLILWRWNKVDLQVAEIWVLRDRVSDDTQISGGRAGEDGSMANGD